MGVSISSSSVGLQSTVTCDCVLMSVATKGCVLLWGLSTKKRRQNATGDTSYQATLQR